MRNKIVLFLTVLFVAGTLVSCEKGGQENADLKKADSRLKSAVEGGLDYTYGVDTTMAFCGAAATTTFSTFGNVKVINNKDSLFIQIKLSNEWRVRWVSVFVGDVADMKVGTDGYPDYYSWPTYTEFNPYPTEVTLKYSFNDIPACGKIFIKMYAVRLDETGAIFRRFMGWVDGTQYESHEAYYTEYCKQSCCVFEDVKYDLVAGQHINVGDVTVTNDKDSLYVTYNTKQGWSLKETHLYVGTYMGLPKNRHGIPVPGKFPYKGEYLAGTSTYTYAIPLSEIKMIKSCLVIAAHAVVQNNRLKCSGAKTETAWSVGKKFNCHRWGWYSTYCLQVCE